MYRFHLRSSFYDFSAKNLEGTEEIQFSKYKGKVLLVVNVASKWGLTKQNYTELTQVYEKYSSEDFEILAFPCNQFGGQEPGSPAEIRQFVNKFGAKYQFFEKINVNGNKAHPAYKWLKARQPGILGVNAIKWNFSKFLIDANGQAVQRYAPNANPLSLTKDIDKYIAKAKEENKSKSSENTDKKSNTNDTEESSKM